MNMVTKNDVCPLTNPLMAKIDDLLHQPWAWIDVRKQQRMLPKKVNLIQVPGYVTA